MMCVFLEDIINILKFYQFILNQFLELKHVILSIDLSMLSMGESDLPLQLIGFMVSLISVYFIFIPIIIQSDKRNYLSINATKWAVYNRDKRLKKVKQFFKNKIPINNIIFEWGIGVILILLGVAFYILNFDILIIILFIIFIFC